MYFQGRRSMFAFVCYLIQIEILFLFLKNQWKKVRDGYKKAIEKHVEQTRFVAGSSKLATCRNF